MQSLPQLDFVRQTPRTMDSADELDALALGPQVVAAADAVSQALGGRPD